MYSQAKAFAMFKNIEVPESIWCGHYNDDNFHRFYFHSNTPGHFINVIAESNDGIVKIYVNDNFGKGEGHQHFAVSPAEAFSVIVGCLKHAVKEGFGRE